MGRKYQFMEQNKQRQILGLNDKIPDIQKTLETVQFLRTRKVGIMGFLASYWRLTTAAAWFGSNRSHI